MNTALQYTALLDLMNLHLISVDLGCVSWLCLPVSFPLTCTSFLPLPPSVSPSWIIFGPHIPVSLFTFAFCLLTGISHAHFVQKKLSDSQQPQAERAVSAAAL